MGKRTKSAGVQIYFFPTVCWFCVASRECAKTCRDRCIGYAYLTQILNGNLIKGLTSNPCLSPHQINLPFSENLAQKGTATQSSTHYSQSANRAIDGGKDSSTSSSSCATTSWENHPWWRLDLQVSAYQVNIVVIYRDDSFPGNTKNIQVKFGNSLQKDGNDNPRWDASVEFGLPASALWH